MSTPLFLRWLPPALARDPAIVDRALALGVVRNESSATKRVLVFNRNVVFCTTIFHYTRHTFSGCRDKKMNCSTYSWQ